MASAEPAVPGNAAPPRPRVVVVVPVFNEEGNLPELRRRLGEVMAGLPAYAFRVILVDDHSADGSRELCREWAGADPHVEYLRFSRNFGSHAACVAGMERVEGDAYALMAADLQDPPEDLPRLLEEWRKGAQVVWAVRTEREGETLSTKVPARMYYFLMRNIAGLQLPPEGADFVLFDGRVRKALLAFGERSNSLFAILCWAGFRQAVVPYVKRARGAGRSGWTFRKKVRLFLDSIIGFTPWPLRVMAVLGGVSAAAGIAYAIVLVYLRIQGEIVVQGWTGLMVVSLLGFGAVMMMTGVLGEYLWRALEETRRRPRYLVEDETDQKGGSGA